MTYIIQVVCVVVFLLCFVFRAYWVKPPPPPPQIEAMWYRHTPGGTIIFPYPGGDTRFKLFEGDTLLQECACDGNGRGVPCDREWLLVAGVEYTILFEAVTLSGKDGAP